MSCGGGGGGELGVGVEHAVEVAADVANASEQACALLFVRVRLKFLDEIDFDHRRWIGDYESHRVNDDVGWLQHECRHVPAQRVAHVNCGGWKSAGRVARTTPRAYRSI